MSQPPKDKSFARTILPVVAVIGLLFAIFLIVRGQPDRSTQTPADLPARPTGALADAPRVAGSGVVEPSSETIDIGTAISGLVSQVAVKPGDYVTKGTPLFQVDERAYRARLSVANAEIAQARATIAEATSASATAIGQLALYQQVEDAAAVSRAEVIKAQGDAAAAQTRLGLARAQLQAAQASAGAAQTDLVRLTVKAPISGEILAVNIHPGEFVQAGGPQGSSAIPYIQMGQTRPLYVRVDIDEDEAPRVDLGKAAMVSPRGAADRQVSAAFVRAEPLVVPKKSLTNTAAERVDVRVLQVLYRLPPSDDFRVGQLIDAFIPARPAKARVTHQQAESGQ